MTDGSRYISHDADGGREGTATPGEPAAASVGPMRYRDTRAITDGAGEAAAVETSAAPVTAPPPLVTDGSPRAASPSDAEVAASGADGGFGFHYQPGRGDVLRPSGNGARDRGDGPPPDPKKPGPTVGSEWVHHVRGESGGVESRPSAAGYVLSDPTPEGGRHSAPLNNAEMARRALRPPPTPRSRRREPTVASGFITNRGGVTSFGPPGTARATGATGHHRTRRSQDQRWGVSGFITFVAKAAG